MRDCSRLVAIFLTGKWELFQQEQRIRQRGNDSTHKRLLEAERVRFPGSDCVSSKSWGASFISGRDIEVCRGERCQGATIEYDWTIIAVWVSHSGFHKRSSGTKSRSSHARNYTGREVAVRMKAGRRR
jgi:hypothetical protein